MTRNNRNAELNGNHLLLLENNNILKRYNTLLEENNNLLKSIDEKLRKIVVNTSSFR